MSILEDFRLMNESIISKYVGILLIVLTFNTLIFDINIDRVSDYKEEFLRALITTNISFQASVIYKDLSPFENVRQNNQYNAKKSLADMNNYEQSLKYINVIESRLKNNKYIATVATIILLFSIWCLERRNIILSRRVFWLALFILVISTFYFTYERFYVTLPPLPSFE